MNCVEYTQDILYSYYDRRITDLLKTGQKKAAQFEAFEWLHEYEKTLCITVPWNWKIAKKQIAAYFFGKSPSVHLHYNDNVEVGIEFINSNSNRNVRCSLHKYDSACHSESRRINPATIEWLLEKKRNMSQKDIIDIFTECSTPTTTCFRRFSLQYNEEVSYEIGYGQAMYVFETERGKHDTAGLNITKGLRAWSKSLDSTLAYFLDQLIENHEQYLSIKTKGICYYLGIPIISIEGYFDTAFPLEKPVIVDLDLPFDRTFF